jgi:hypothetical protein
MLASVKRGKKLIKSIEYVPTPDSAFEVKGFFQSPFEPKIVLLISYRATQFEGNQIIRELPIGADLKKGNWM